MEFTASQITEITGVKRTRLQQWLEKDYLAPSIQQASGPGARNIYSLIDVYRIAIFKRITESGLSRKLVADMLKKTLVIEIINESNVSRIKDMVYIRKGDDVEAFALSDRDASITLLNLHQPTGDYDTMFIINFEKIREEIDLKIEAIMD